MKNIAVGDVAVQLAHLLLAMSKRCHWYGDDVQCGNIYHFGGSLFQVEAQHSHLVTAPDHLWKQQKPSCLSNRRVTRHGYTYINGLPQLCLSCNYPPIWPLFNSSPPGQNGPHFADDIVSCIFVNEMCCILIKISLTVVLQGPIDNKPALV